MYDVVYEACDPMDVKLALFVHCSGNAYMFMEQGRRMAVFVQCQPLVMRTRPRMFVAASIVTIQIKALEDERTDKKPCSDEGLTTKRLARCE